jgi:hypothetical protein
MQTRDVVFERQHLMVSDIRAIGESEGHKRGQGQLLGTLRTAQDSREIRQNPTNNEHDHRNIEHFSSDTWRMMMSLRNSQKKLNG